MEEITYSIESSRLMIHYFNKFITNQSVREQLAKMIVGAKTLKAQNSIQENRKRKYE